MSNQRRDFSPPSLRGRPVDCRIYRSRLRSYISGSPGHCLSCTSSRRKKVSGSSLPRRISVPNARTHRAETLTQIPRILQDAPRKEEGTRARARRERGHGGRGTCPPTPAPSTVPRITRHGPGRQPPREIAEPTPLRPREGRRTDVAD